MPSLWFGLGVRYGGGDIADDIYKRTYSISELSSVERIMCLASLYVIPVSHSSLPPFGLTIRYGLSDLSINFSAKSQTNFKE